MMENKVYYIFIIVLLVIIGVQQYKLVNIEDTSIISDKIEQLEEKIETLIDKRDSVRVVIDSTHVKIITNEKHYEEVVNTIVNNSDSINRIFLDGYIKRYIDRIRGN